MTAASSRVDTIEEETKEGEATSGKKQPKPTPVREFTGSMEMGMAIVMAMQILQVLVSTIFVYWAREELIFPDRVAPKFVFDLLRALLSLGFAAFWM